LSTRHTLHGFTHIYEPTQASERPVLILFHSMGSNEEDMLGVGRLLDPRAALLSVRGKEQEEGKTRYYLRQPDGSPDPLSARQRANELAAFLKAAESAYNISSKKRLAVGYSNGGNMVAALLLLHPELFDGAIILHSRVPLIPDELPDLSGKPLLLTGGSADELIPPKEVQIMEYLFKKAGADVTTFWQSGGHNINHAEMRTAQRWLAEHTAS
jgi:phospholipase/carboxylesterase